jgi:hypothetical protein
MDFHPARNALCFEGGEVLECEGSVVGIGPDLALYQGYKDVLDPWRVLTLSEAAELCDAMIGLWQRKRLELQERQREWQERRANGSLSPQAAR